MLMIGKPLTAEQRLQKNVTALMGHEYFVALTGVLMSVEHEIDRSGATRTACTNGKWARYSPEFVETLSDAEFRFLILHETYHCLFQHMTTWDWMYDEDGDVANQACDYVINLMINEAETTIGKGFLVMPEGGLLDTRWRDMDAAQVFRQLRKEKQTQQGQGQGGQCQPGQPGQGQGQGQGQPRPGQPGQPSGAGLDDHDWAGAQALSQEEKDEIARTMSEAVRQGALLAGKTGSGGMRELEQLMQSKVRWQDALREFMHDTCKGNEFSTWRRPNRRLIAQNIYMPSGVSETLGEIVVAIDTSGSIGGKQIAQFLGEVKAICETLSPEKVRLLYWDTKVVRDEVYMREELDTLTTSTKPAGGGGTAPSCVTSYMAEHNIKPQVVVVLTDGYVGNDWGGTWPSPVVWCVVGSNITAPSGVTINVEWEN